MSWRGVLEALSVEPALRQAGADGRAFAGVAGDLDGDADELGALAHLLQAVVA